jgi:hypothetical protein
VLLDTLETWLDTGGSSEAAATALFCHPNTVRHAYDGSKPRPAADCAPHGTSPTFVSHSPPSASPHSNRPALYNDARDATQPLAQSRPGSRCPVPPAHARSRITS